MARRRASSEPGECHQGQVGAGQHQLGAHQDRQRAPLGEHPEAADSKQPGRQGKEIAEVDAHAVVSGRVRRRFGRALAVSALLDRSGMRPVSSSAPPAATESTITTSVASPTG